MLFSKTVGCRSDLAGKEVTEDYKCVEWEIAEGKGEACLNMPLTFWRRNYFLNFSTPCI